MEDNDFQWLTRALSVTKARVNLLETVFFHSGALDSWMYTDESGAVKRKGLGDDGVTCFSDVVSYFLSKSQRSLRKTASSAVCYSVWKGERTTVDATQAEEIAGKRDTCLRSNFIQEYREVRGVLTYFHAKYTRKGYSCTAFRSRAAAKERETSERLMYKMRDVCLIILSAVEHAKLRRVMDLELEFMVDDSNSLWLMGSRLCRVAVPAFCHAPRPAAVNEPPKGLKAMLTKQKTKTYEKEDETMKKTLAEWKYLFKRGQLRNQRSNLGSPIRLRSPATSSGNQSEGEGNPTDTAEETAKLSASTLVHSGKTDRFNNSNFQEMLLMTFAKRKKLSPRAIASPSDLHSYMESVLFPADSIDSPLSQSSVMNKLRISYVNDSEQAGKRPERGNQSVRVVAKARESEETARGRRSELPVIAAKRTGGQKKQTLSPPVPAITTSRSEATLPFLPIHDRKAVLSPSCKSRAGSYILAERLRPVLAGKNRKPLQTSSK